MLCQRKTIRWHASVKLRHALLVRRAASGQRQALRLVSRVQRANSSNVPANNSVLVSSSVGLRATAPGPRTRAVHSAVPQRERAMVPVARRP